MIMILRLRSDQHCGGCGDPEAFCCQRTGLCLYCLGLKAKVLQRQQKLEEQKRKVTETMAQKFACLAGRIQRQLKEFRTAPRKDGNA